MHFHIRPVSGADLDEVLAIQRAAYPESLLESREFFLNRWAIAPAHSWVAQSEDGLLGYLIAYPWHGGLPPVLDAPILTLPPAADHWFLHDCAVAPWAQKLGVARRLLQVGLQGAVDEGLGASSLVSLSSATSYWLSQGYVPVHWQSPELADKLAGYGTQACYMMRPLPMQRFP